MPNDRGHRYDAVPPIPSYDEAMADRSQSESQSLLFSSESAPSSSSRRNNGYRQPTVESDDELSLLSDDDDGDERYVRREMQELEMGEPDRGPRSLFGKRIPFSISLPQWKWSWRPRLPNLRRTIRLPSGPSDMEAAGENDGESATPRRRFVWPRISLEGVNGRMVALIVARVMAITIVLGFLYVVFVSDVFDAMARRFGTGLRFNPDEVRRWVQNQVEPAGMRACVHIYTEYAHLAGTQGDFALAEDMTAMFTKAKMESIHLEEFYAYLNFPKPDGRAVEILGDDGKAEWTARLEELDPKTESKGTPTPVFNALSKSGDVKGPLIYANRGSPEDFKLLKEKGVNMKGAIAIVRYNGIPASPGLKVKAAAEAGFAGCLLYSDPGDNKNQKAGEAPAGPLLSENGVQRTSVALSNWVIGDVLTPGWSSKNEHAPRIKLEQNPKGLVSIPSLPLGAADARHLLNKLNGKGSEVPKDWQGGVPDVATWWTGDETSPVVHLKNLQDENVKQKLWNVYSKIQGVEQREKSIIIGNPRDSLSFGATGPHSGTAVMVELARVFGLLMDKGWRPLRNIEFMSWDGSGHNFIGSTEYVEENVERLKRDAYAYINLDEAVWGNELHVSGSPVFRNALVRAMSHVEDPFQNKTLHQLWHDRGGEIESMNDITGDWAAFQNIAGTNSIQLEFRGDDLPRGSNENGFNWVNKHGDPGFVYHAIMAKLVAMLVLELADRPIVPFDIDGYTQKMDKWADELNEWLRAKIKASEKPADVPSLNTDQLKIALHEVRSAAKTFQEWETTWDSIVLANGGWESAALNVQRLGFNNQMALFESALIDPDDQGGISPDRKQFKHAVFGPPAWPGTKDEYFPIIRAAAEAGDWALVDKRIMDTCNWLRNAVNILRQSPESMIDD